MLRGIEMKKIIFGLLAVACCQAVAFAGGGTGGGTPPAREKLLEQLMSAELGQGGLYDNGLGDIGLLTNRELQPEMTLTKSQLLGADIKVPDTDFEMLRDRRLPLDSVGLLGENKSFSITAGDQLDSIKLIDRRAAARAAVAQ
jgi:hypothetical protein